MKSPLLSFLLILLCAGWSRASPAQDAALSHIDANHAATDADGTVRMQRIVPLPHHLSPEAQAWLKRAVPSDQPVAQTLTQRRDQLNVSQTRHRDELLKMFPAVTITDKQVAGVPVHDVVPKGAHADRVLICLHGGGFNADSGSYSESIPVAAMTGTRVVSVLYRLAPEAPFPAAVDDVVAVYRELLKTYAPRHIGIFGSSAGAGLTLEAAVRLKQLKLPLPGALGSFSTPSDMVDGGDSRALYNTDGLRGFVPVAGEPLDPEYVGTTDRKDPVLSPLYADLDGMPPTLFLSSERDLLLSATSMVHRAFLQAGADARLIVFEGLPHCFWNNNTLPETREAWGYMAGFLTRNWGGSYSVGISGGSCPEIALLAASRTVCGLRASAATSASDCWLSARTLLLICRMVCSASTLTLSLGSFTNVITALAIFAFSDTACPATLF